MVPSAELDFNLQPLLQQLNQEELSKFKSLLRALSLKDELQHIPQTEVEEADGKQLADILTKCCPSCWVETVTIQVFDKMNRTDLSERAKDELRGKQKQVHTVFWEEGVTVSTICKQDKYRNILKKKFWHLWKNLWPGASENVHSVTQRYETLIPFCNPKMPAGPFPHTVVLHGPAGVGKTTLAKKLMLDWTQDNLVKTFNSAFYLSCKDLSHKDTCTFAELILRKRPDLQDAIPEMLAQAREILFIIDGFDELRVPSGALVHDICGDWQKEKPVPVLLGSLLKRKMLPKSSLVITTRPGALRELRLLVEQPLFIEIEGFLELDRRAYFLKHFEEESQALRAFDLMKNNAALFHMGSAPAVCWIICTCLKRQMEKGEDPASTCQTTTSLFLRFLCSQFTPAHSSCPGVCLQAPVKSVCLLAAEGIWTQTSVFDGEDLERLGVKESALCPFLDKNILQKSTDCEGCYSFIHLSVQQFLAAMFYVLETKEEEEEEDVGGHRWHIGDVQKLLSKEERLKNPNLTQVGYFLFGLSKEERALELETTFGCLVSMEVKKELLKCRSMPDGKKPFSMTDMKEILYCLYESQEEELVKDAMAPVKEMSLNLKNEMDIMHSSFCLKHCRNLQKLSLQVEKGIFLENDTSLKSGTQVERSQNDQHLLPFWMDLCSVFDSSRNLIVLDVTQSFLSTSSARILCEKIAAATSSLQKVVLKNISPADAYRNFCVTFGGQETLTHLTLQGNDQDDMLPPLCEVLRHQKCNLQYLRLVSCSATAQQWADLSCCLKINQSLTCLNLTANEFLDEGASLLYTTLKHPVCFLQRLSLENCHLTEAYCKDLSSALIVNQRLTHLCLAKNALGDRGVKLLCEGLSYPECQLQTLVLWCCNITSDGCTHLSRLLQHNSSLTHLDLGLNHIGITGLKFLCEALKKPLCKLRCLWLWGCAISPFCCTELSSALRSNQNLITLDLGQNSLGYSGVKMLCDALKLQSCPLRTLRLKIDECDARIQKLLKEMEENNSKLTIESDHQDPKNNRPSSRDFIF
ncbi:LOW QUALITY PROTEIN: NACHT, LRR and PYD domains-containing protein 2 [Hippopotamus amphibius kiboko]|uniref:LOW QUALITY PROTEIN: NACHT, LRR and PYD domains-containing protein 2 n=1 Tax=Hippopotamus amphibius kiboko TaxID=575201 RepID=UPI002597D58B|nr:LOW QUALITY PROTEIN: NACHT, LRR and PYD domains-containing protein 2 [Hippopotamus amphibius kiboko]